MGELSKKGKWGQKSYLLSGGVEPIQQSQGLLHALTTGPKAHAHTTFETIKLET